MSANIEKTDVESSGKEDLVMVGHCKFDPTDVYIGRSRGGDGDMTNTEVGERGWLGNPFTVEEYGREGCIKRCRVVFEKRLKEDAEFREAVKGLAGQMLGCWCHGVNEKDPDACHGDFIATYVEKLASGEWVIEE